MVATRMCTLVFFFFISFKNRKKNFITYQECISINIANGSNKDVQTIFLFSSYLLFSEKFLTVSEKKRQNSWRDTHQERLSLSTWGQERMGKPVSAANVGLSVREQGKGTRYKERLSDGNSTGTFDASKMIPFAFGVGVISQLMSSS